ncbi:hypothetical protein QBC37DRAFT_205840 [Rhypophila decipiens]|uniref:Pre-mRNA-splicing factor 38B n=1 Tax=Rhypophila decipiens TaxID=261697 RepID=A0AAN6Y424_9PEZI|nr:hypothetical protein QBC37DRAFT_205840 [Rhypophila decipiens]
MSSDSILTDDYVAELLAKEASEASIKYSAMGLDAFKSTKMPANKAKPNTRFLGRIIKETTNHNAALLAKEAAEAQARLDDLTEAEEKKRRKLRPTPSDIRRRQLGDISSILQGGRRKRKTEEASAEVGDSAQESNDKTSSRKHSPTKREGTRHAPDESKKDSRHRHRTREHRDDDRGHHKSRHRSRSPEGSSSRRKYRDRSPLSDEERGHKSHSKRKSRPESSRNGGDLFGDELSKHKRDGRLARDDNDGNKDDSSSRRSRHRERSYKELEDEAEYSDPLEQFIGPVPPGQSSTPVVRPRGRGVPGGKALMDTRFSDSYDPRSDSNGDVDRLDSDWDEAVDSFRDHRKWIAQGADRLRTAGFTEEQIKKWEKQKPGGAEKDLADVKWTKQGEKREWDRGKEVLLEEDD